MTAESPPSAVSRAIGALVAVVLTAGILGGGWLLVSKPRDPTPRPEPGDVLLSTRLDMPLGQGSARVRLRAPGTLRFTIDGSDGPVTAWFGVPPQPTPNGQDAPDPATAVSWTVLQGAAPHEERVYGAGLYVLRLVRGAPIRVATDGRDTELIPAEARDFVPPTPSAAVEIREVSKR